MRKVLTLILAFSTIFLFAQEEQPYPKNELKTNVINALLLEIITLNYERLISEEAGVGLNLAVFAASDVDANLTISPYYRHYFGKKPAAGFFVEGTGVIATFDADDFDGNDVTVGVGLAIGAKLLSKSDWVFEGFIGAGRLFVDVDIFGNDGGSGIIYPRLAINIGKRF